MMRGLVFRGILYGSVFNNGVYVTAPIGLN
jgi:hypothetical protein